MARKTKTLFVCNNCGQEYARWQGKCFNCGQWECIVEFRQPARKSSSRRSARAAAPEPVVLSRCPPQKSARAGTGLREIDRVLGGGLVADGVVLLGGDPGIGKSTLLLQLCARVAEAGSNVLYVSGEESPQQISLRAARCGIAAAAIHVLAETSAEATLEAIEKLSPNCVVIDSIQTLFSEELESAPGSVSQVRECAAMLIRYAKKQSCAVFLVGHVTKEGAIAGPRVLEHMVDTVLYFEGDANYQYRILRSVKNRFGPAGEIALFSMHDKGLKELSNCADLFVLNRDNPQVGSAFVPMREGSRIMVVEVQALVNPTHFGLPQRVAAGINPKKLALSLAVLERYGGASLGAHDVFFNVAGGLTIQEPAADMGIAAAVVSSFYNKPLKNGVALIGEVGLGGEVRPVNNMRARLKELASIGFTRCVVPKPEKNADWADENTRITLLPLAHIQYMRPLIFP
jgi:DNA repair protein RadA/Sms